MALFPPNNPSTHVNNEVLKKLIFDNIERNHLIIEFDGTIVR